MNLILIHGRDQQGKDPVKLRKEWIDTLKAGLKAQGLELPGDVNIIFPFYGDVLDALARQIDGAVDLTGVIARGAMVDHNKTAYYELLNEMAEQAGLTIAEIQSYYEGEAIVKGPLNWAWVQAIAAALDNCDRIGWSSVERFTADVAFYLNQPTAMRRSTSSLLQQLTTDHV